jgi:hypothetical protein
MAASLFNLLYNSELRRKKIYKLKTLTRFDLLCLCNLGIRSKDLSFRDVDYDVITLPLYRST